MTEFIPLEKIPQSKAGLILCYPKFDEKEAERRLEELRSLGVTGIELRGRHLINGMPVLGKGNVGVVTAARLSGNFVALKIRRVDSDRGSMEAEAGKLGLANEVGVGPRLLSFSRDFLLMEFIEGEYLEEWLSKLGPDDIVKIKNTLRRLIDDARKLDEKGLDHGELSRAPKHVIIANDRPMIIDFESASTGRRVSNVTSIVHYLYLNKGMRDSLSRILKLPQMEPLLEALRKYKESRDQESYTSLLKALGLSQ